MAASSDGTRIDFGFSLSGKMSARFDLKLLALGFDPPSDGSTTAPRQDTLKVLGWSMGRPTLAGRPLPLDPYETSHSLAVHPAGDRFVLGAEWSLRAFDGSGAQLWRRPVPGVVWAVTSPPTAGLS
jgi:hypothetical protein